MAYSVGQRGRSMAPRFHLTGPTVTNPNSSVGSMNAVATVINASPAAVGARVTYAYQWYRGTLPLAASTIANATSASYSVVGADRTASGVVAQVTLTSPHGTTRRNVIYPVTLP
jgi:hypothetical protein